MSLARPSSWGVATSAVETSISVYLEFESDAQKVGTINHGVDNIQDLMVIVAGSLAEIPYFILAVPGSMQFVKADS